MDIDFVDEGNTRRCARCADKIINVLSGFGCCDTCAQEGYQPPVVSSSRTLENGKRGIRLCDGGGITCVNEGLSPNSILNSSSHQTLNGSHSVPEDQNVTNGTCNVNGKWTQSSPSRVDGVTEIIGVSSLSLEKQVGKDASLDIVNCYPNPDSAVVANPSVTRRLWNHVGALRRDNDINVNCRLTEENCEKNVIDHFSAYFQKSAIEDDHKIRVQLNRMSLVQAAEIARSAAKRRKNVSTEAKGGVGRVNAGSEYEDDDDEIMDRYSVLTQEKLGIGGMQQPVCSINPDDSPRPGSGSILFCQVISWTALVLMLITLLASALDMHYGLGLRTVEWRLRHVGDSPPV